MDPFSDFEESIIERDIHGCRVALSRIADQSEASIRSLISVLDLLPRLVEAFPRKVTLEEWAHRIIWYDFEMIIWQIGETFRQIIKRHNKYRRHPELFDHLSQVAMNSTYGKGRESFVMLLGKYGGPTRIQVLRDLLKDEQVSGHAVYALRLLSAREAADEIRPFLNAEKTWIRNEAKKYFQKIEKGRET